MVRTGGILVPAVLHHARITVRNVITLMGILVWIPLVILFYSPVWLPAVILVVCGHKMGACLGTNALFRERFARIMVILIGYAQLLCLFLSFTAHMEPGSQVVAFAFVLFLSSMPILVGCGHMMKAHVESNTWHGAPHRRVILFIAYVQLLFLPFVLQFGLDVRDGALTHECQRNLRQVTGAYGCYLEEHTNGPAIKAVSDFVLKYMDKEVRCPRAGGKPYIISNNTAICPVVDKYPRHTLSQ